MKVDAAVAQILKHEGVDFMFGYPRNPILEAAAHIGIRPILVRQERTGVHMADALSRRSAGERMGVFAMQAGPGTENAFGGVAQAFAESVPLVVLPGGASRSVANIRPNFSALLNFGGITKWIEQPSLAASVPDAMRRAFMQARNGRPGPALVEFPYDLFDEEVPEPLRYGKTRRLRFGPDPKAVSEVAAALVAASRPVIYAGQGVHYARAYDQLQALAELLEAPVLTSIPGKSTFPENHPLALGCGGGTAPKQLNHFLNNADLVFGIGCSFSATPFNVQMPKGKRYIHATIDATDINKDISSELALVGDAALVLEAVIEEVRDRLHGKPRGNLAAVAGEIARVKAEWMEEWLPRLTSNSAPLSPYRVIWDLLNNVDAANTIITHDSGSPRNQITPFWVSPKPGGYIGWGKSTQLGYGLGLAMGSKLAEPDKLCINFWGDAAIGFTGTDLETAVRNDIPILSILVNNSTMAAEHTSLPTATEKFRTTDISGNYADFARSLGLYSERITRPDEVAPAIRRGIAKTKDGKPTLLEFITEYSSPASRYK